VDARFLLGNAARLALKGELAFQFDRIPLVAKGVRGRKARNLARISANRLLHVSRTLGYPYMAHVAPSGVCNLRCERCPAHDEHTAGRTLLPYETFERFLEQTAGYLLYVILWAWGEPLLNPEIYRMIRLATERNVLTVTSSHMNTFSTQNARDMVAAELDALIIAVDGADPETYERLRPGGDFEAVIANTKLLLDEKRKTGSKKPYVNLRMVVSRDNENEVPAFKRLGRELGVDMISFKAYSTRQAGFSDPEWDRTRAPEDERLRWYEYGSDFDVNAAPGRYDCRFPWTKPTLFADGSVLMCEFDLGCEHPFGNINEQPFAELWFSDRGERMRHAFQRDRDSFEFCRDCVYDYSVIDGCVLEAEYLTDADGT